MVQSDTQTLDALGAAVAAAWTQSRRRPCTAVETRLDGGQLTIALDGLLSAGELALANHPTGSAALARTLDVALQGVYPALAHLVEESLAAPIAQSQMVIDGERKLVTCVLTLQHLPFPAALSVV